MASPEKKAGYDVSRQVKDAIERGDWAEVARILSECSRRDSDSVMTQLVSRDQWDAVKQVIRCVGDEGRTWDIDGVLVTKNILLSVAEGNWRGIGDMPHEHFLYSTMLWILTKACKRATEREIIHYALPHCEDGQVGEVLQQLVAQSKWFAVGKVLQRGVDHEHLRWVIHEACERAYDWVIRAALLPQCSNSILEFVLAELVSHSKWYTVEHVLKIGVGDTQLCWAVLEACERATVWQIRYYLLPHCTRNHLCRVMAESISREAWTSVSKLLQCVKDRITTWTVDKLCVESHLLHLIAKQKVNDILLFLLDCIKDSQQTIAFLQGWAQESYQCFQVCWRSCDGQAQPVFFPAHPCVSKTGFQSSVVNLKTVLPTVNSSLGKNNVYLVPQCAYDKLVSVLANTQSFADNVCPNTWLVHRILLDPETSDVTAIPLSFATDDQIANVLMRLFTENAWWALGKVPQQEVDDVIFTRILESLTYHVDTFLEILVAICNDAQADLIMATMVGRGQWDSVATLLSLKGGRKLVWTIEGVKVETSMLQMLAARDWRRVGTAIQGGDSQQTRWLIHTLCLHADVIVLAHYVLPYCSENQLDCMLITLVEQSLWRAVGELLKRGASDSVKRWAVMEACQHCDDSAGYYDIDAYITENILPHCADDQLDSVLTTLVERRLWGAVGEMLKRDVSDSVKRGAVMEACQHGGDSAGYYDVAQFRIDIILPHCADDQLDSALTTLVERRIWLSAQHVLERFAGDLNKGFAGQKTCEHCRSAGVYLSKCRIHDSDCLVDKPFTPHCGHGNVDSPTSALTKPNACTAVRNMSGREVSDAQRRENIRAAFRHADEDTLIKRILPHYVYGSLHYAIKTLASRGFWSAFLVLLHTSIIDTLYIWAAAKETESKDEVFLDVVRNPCDGVKDLSPAMWRSVTWSGLQRSLKQLLDWNTPLCEVLCESLLGTVKEIWLGGREKEILIKEDRVKEEALSTVEHLHQMIAPVLMECKTYHVSDLLSCTEGVRRKYAERRSEICVRFQLYFIKSIVLQYYKRKAWEQMTNTILVALTTVPVVPDVQSVALRVMLRHNRWDIVRHACLSGVCEQDRRQLFHRAVKQRQWSAVKRWADHTLYDDQRLWALGEARQEKRWDVYLKLADHGLHEWERVGVHFRLTMHADWKLIHHMLTTVADVTDMIDLLTNTPGVVSKLGVKNKERRMNDLKVFENNLMKDTHTLNTLKTMAKRGQWCVVLHNVRHQPNLQHARLALKAAVSSEAWHAVMQLVRLETDVTRRDSLFRDMVRLRQWAVCRELLEQGVSSEQGVGTELCLELLPALTEHCQWTLVAMTMKYEMDDERRKYIIHQALMTREGSVVWECITKLQTRLSVTERKEIFQLAFNREVWQAVKPLIEEKDVTGIRHRDTALLEAIEQHQWDVVDHCQRHQADINMKDDDGHTPIHRAARKGDWEAVKELTVRDGDPNLLDRGGLAVLHRAIIAEQWDAVKLLIQYHGHIHQAAQYNYGPTDSLTPLGMLIDARQRELIELTLMWCPDQWKSVSGKGETVLHVAFLSDWIDLVYYLIARKVDPLAVTMRGHTALCYAVLCKGCPQRMVAECIKLGFSTHQSHITHTARIDMTRRSGLLTEEEERLLMSPFVLAVMRGLPVVTQMLCEAGACSNRQLCELNVHLVELTKPNTDKGRRFRREFSEAWEDVHNLGYSDPDYSFDTELMEQSADYLRQVSSTPRSLVSTCRLVISRCLTLSKTRHRDIAQLPLSPRMKEYLMFSDLADPRYPDLSYRGKE